MYFFFNSFMLCKENINTTYLTHEFYKVPIK